MEAPTGATRLAAVIGSPVRHSLSPALHNAAFAAVGLDWVYLALEVPEGEVPEALAGARALGLGGLSVTMPHKEAAARACDRVTDDAAALGAVNCVVIGDGELVGHNTDGDGFLSALRIEGFDPEGVRCVVLGAGGAARSVALALARSGAEEVAILNRTEERARQAVELLGGCGRVLTADDAPDAIAEAYLVVNATSVGMGQPGPDDVPVDVDLLHRGQLVVDLVYQPLETPLLAAASDRGAVALNGVPMLVHQAAVAFSLWTGLPAPLDAMTAAVGLGR